MNLVEFKSAAQRTLVALKSKDEDIEHMLVGMITEIGELLDVHKKTNCYGKEFDHINYQEELGDAAWYLVNLMTIVDMEEIPGNKYVEFHENTTSIHRLTLTLSIVSNVFHHRNTVEDAVCILLGCIDAECRQYGYNRSKILDTNIAKLKTRYPEKFTKEQALYRDLDAERNTLVLNTETIIESSSDETNDSIVETNE